jgi:exosortase K
MLQRLKRVGPYGFCAALAWVLKAHYSQAGASGLLWILAPTAKVVEWIGGKAFYFDSLKGFVNPEYGIVIAPVCSGVNFLLVAFLMAFFSFAGRFESLKSRMIWVPVSLMLSFGLSVMANSLRIMVSMASIARNLHWGWFTAGRVHLIQGIAVHFFFLVLFYIVLDWFTGWADERRKAGKGFGPFLWYFGVLLAVPVLTGNYKAQGGLFREYAMAVVLCSVFVHGAVYAAIRLFLPIFRGCGINRGRDSNNGNDEGDHDAESSNRGRRTGHRRYNPVCP